MVACVLADLSAVQLLLATEKQSHQRLLKSYRCEKTYENRKNSSRATNNH